MYDIECLPDSELISPVLRDFRAHLPSHVIHELKDGDCVRNGTAGYYLIDNARSLLARFGTPDEVPTREIRTLFDGNEQKVHDYFASAPMRACGKPLVPFSEALEHRLGSCLEESIITQIVQQRMPSVHISLLLTGYLGDHEGWRYHAFNMRCLKNMHAAWRVFDVGAPRRSPGFNIHEFLLADVTPGRGEGGRKGLILETTRWDGWQYFLPLEYSADRTRMNAEGRGALFRGL